MRVTSSIQRYITNLQISPKLDDGNFWRHTVTHTHARALLQLAVLQFFHNTIHTYNLYVLFCGWKLKLWVGSVSTNCEKAPKKYRCVVELFVTTSWVTEIKTKRILVRNAYELTGLFALYPILFVRGCFSHQSKNCFFAQFTRQENRWKIVSARTCNCSDEMSFPEIVNLLLFIRRLFRCFCFELFFFFGKGPPRHSKSQWQPTNQRRSNE